jgi:hypothetical protein
MLSFLCICRYLYIFSVGLSMFFYFFQYRFPVFAIYLANFLFDTTGMKKYGRHYLVLTVNLLRIKGGFKELLRILLYSGYVSP